MPGVVYYQSNVSQTFGTSSISTTYLSDNGGETIGVAYVVTAAGTIPSSVDDTNGNNWYLLQEQPSNLGTQSWWVCPVLNKGPNTVTAHGPLTAFGTIMFVLEYSPPCPQGGTCIDALNPPSLEFQPTPPLAQSALFNMNSGTWYHTLIAGIWDNYDSAEITTRTWSITVPSANIANGVRAQLNLTGGNKTAAVADCTMGNPNNLNYISFNYTPTIPPMGPDYAYTTGILISTQL